MFYALRVGLTFAVVVILLQIFFGQIFFGLTDLVGKMIFVANYMVDDVIEHLPDNSSDTALTY